MVDTEREMICRVIEKDASEGRYCSFIDKNLFNENIELLRNEGYEVRQKSDEWGIVTIISWYPGRAKKSIFNF